MEKIICETPRLILREIQPGDLDPLMSIFGDAEVMRFSVSGIKTPEQVVKIIEGALKGYARDGVGPWAVVLKESGELIGECGILVQMIKDIKEYEVSYRFAKKYWGKGYAAEAAIASRDYGFNVKSLPRLISIIEAANSASIRVAERLGMKYESDDLFHGIPVKIYSLKNPRIGGTIIRRILPSDIEPLERLFFRTVRQINVRDYTKEQVEAWAPANGDFDKWRKSFEGKSVFVSEEKSVVSGFCELEPNGHIDRFYVSADRIGQGLGRMMYQALEQEASVLKIRRLFAEASITAKPFFEKMGFTVVKEQVVNVKGIAMTNFVMEKKLPQP